MFYLLCSMNLADILLNCWFSSHFGQKIFPIACIVDMKYVKGYPLIFNHVKWHNNGKKVLYMFSMLTIKEVFFKEIIRCNFAEHTVFSLLNFHFSSFRFISFHFRSTIIFENTFLYFKLKALFLQYPGGFCWNCKKI